MAIRHRILSRDCGLCVACQAKGKLTLATEVDHITPLYKGGTDAYDNLQSLCAECHKAKTAQDTVKHRRAAIGADGWPIY